MPKGPRGSTSHGVCLLKGSCLVGDYVPGFDYVYPRVNFGLVCEKADGHGRWREG